MFVAPSRIPLEWFRLVRGQKLRKKDSFKGHSKPTTTTKFNSRESGRERQSLYIQEETHKTKLYADQLIGNERVGRTVYECK